MTETIDVQRFRVRGRHEDAHHGRVVDEASFEAAAIAYVEHLPALPDDRTAIGVLVRDVHTGHERSFSIHIEDGEATLDA